MELHADELVAVHFTLDPAHAERLQRRWERFDHDTRLRVIDCPDRQLSRAAHQLVLQPRDDYPGTQVTVLLPRRTYSPLLGRLLHDRTADKMAKVISRIPGASAQILPYDIKSRITLLTREQRDDTRPGEVTRKKRKNRHEPMSGVDPARQLVE